MASNILYEGVTCNYDMFSIFEHARAWLIAIHCGHLRLLSCFNRAETVHLGIQIASNFESKMWLWVIRVQRQGLSRFINGATGSMSALHPIPAPPLTTSG